MTKTISHTLKRLISGIAFAVAWGASAADPAETEKSKLMQFLEQDYLLGDWGGLRTDLSNRGVDFEFFYLGAVPSSLSGGIKHGSVYEGALLMTLDLDSQKLVGYQGGHFHAGSVYIHNGPEFAKFYVGDLNKASLLDFPDTFRLWELWYQHKFFGDRLTLKLGQLDIGQDFIKPEFYNSLASLNFLNQTFFYPTLAFNVYDIAGLPPGSHALASTPYGAPGVFVRVDPRESIYVQAGAYDGNPDRSFSGTRVNLNEDEGALIYFEVGYRLNQGREAQGLPGNYKLGAYYHTDEFLDVYEATLAAFGAGPPARNLSGNYGVYFLADQYLSMEKAEDDPAKQGLIGFFRVAGAPSDRNLTQFGVDGGLVYRGPIPGRDWDTVGIAGSYLELSDDVARAFAAVGLPEPDYEAVVEFSYRAQMTAWWTLQADVQWIMHPGAKTDPTRPPIDDALVFIVQTGLRF
jgi:porin